MKLTTQQQEEAIGAIDAHRGGKPFQYFAKVVGEWRDVDNNATPLECLMVAQLVRPKPEPKVRDWNCPADVPVDCWLRLKSGNTGWESRVIMVNHGRVTIVGGHADTLTALAYDDLRNYEHSTDRKTWKPCVVSEEAA